MHKKKCMEADTNSCQSEFIPVKFTTPFVFILEATDVLVCQDGGPYLECTFNKKKFDECKRSASSAEYYSS